MTAPDLQPATTPRVNSLGPRSAPRFSIVMPAFNAEDTIERAIASVIAQSNADWELIVVDDGSTDATGAYARNAANGDHRVRILRQENAGVARARNVAISNARGEFICFLDSDDAMLPDYLDLMEAFVTANPECALFSGNAQCVGPSGQTSLWRSGPGFSAERSFTLVDLIRCNDVFIMATVRRDVLNRLGGMDPSLASAEDYDMWLRILAAGYRHMYTPEVLGVYYRRPDSISADQLAESTAIASMMSTLSDDRDLSRVERAAARRRARTARARAELERRRLEADYSCGRRAALATVAAFEDKWRRLAGIALALISPRGYFRLLSGRRNEQLSRLYSTASDAPASDEES